MALGKNIKRIRESKNLSQEQLSELTGGKVSQGAISALEKRDSTSSRHAPLLAKALNVKLSELHGEDEYELTPEIINHIKVLQSLPDYARTEVIRDAIKTAELITKAQSSTKHNGTTQ